MWGDVQQRVNDELAKGGVEDGFRIFFNKCDYIIDNIHNEEDCN